MLTAADTAYFCLGLETSSSVAPLNATPGPPRVAGRVRTRAPPAAMPAR
jgi:hypothetical protein